VTASGARGGAGPASGALARGAAACGTHSMAGPLVRALVAAPEAAGWGDAGREARWRDLGYARPPSSAAAGREHAALRAALADAGVELVDLPASGDLSLDAVYTHDASFMTDRGAIILRMGKPARSAEPERHAALYRAAGIPIFGAIHEPGTAEGGDLVWLDQETLLAGRGYRTNAAGMEQIRTLLSPLGVEVIAMPLPHGGGPERCLHLMSLMSLLDEGAVLVDPSRLAVETMEILLARRFRLIAIDPSERDTLACNVLALGGGRLLAFEENPGTIARLRAAGFDVRAVPGRELGGNGGGGPTCLTRPLLRAPHV
jgi:N-dimethylarginine dimethylaminohydrolase